MKIAIICGLENNANSIRPDQFKKIFMNRGHTVELINTIFLHRLSRGVTGKPVWQNIIPYPDIRSLFCLGMSLIDLICNKRSHAFFLKWQLKLRAEILEDIIKKNKFNVILCDNAYDSYIMTKNLDCLKIYGCPTPFADELYFGGVLSGKYYQQIKEMELETYQKADYLSFHGRIYGDYVRKYYNYAGKNIFNLDLGCEPKPKSKIAKYDMPPRIVFIGFLGGYWSNLRLLSKLTKIYPHIDVYGAPSPDKKLGLNYKGWARPIDVLPNYQFGLITITKDRLRSMGFSAKHIEYISYGLPVLVPDWRHDPNLDSVSLHYNEKNFLSVIRRYSDKENWQKISNICLKRSKDFRWDKATKELVKIIDNYHKTKNKQ